MRHVVLGALCVIAAIAYIQRNCLGVAEQEIRGEFGMTEQEMGGVMGGFFLTYGLFQVPAGWLAQTWGTRRALSVFAAFWSVGTAIGALAMSWPILLATRLSMGMAEAGIFPVLDEYDKQMVSGDAAGVGLRAAWQHHVGRGAAGVFLTGALLGTLGWKTLFILYALPALPGRCGSPSGFVTCRASTRRSMPEEACLIGGQPEEIPGTPALTAEPTPWRALLTSPAMGWICGKQFFYAAGTMFFASWFPTYLRETRGVTLGQAGVLTSLPLLAMVGGCLTGGVVSDWIYTRTGSRSLSRRWLAACSMLICAVIVVAAYPIKGAVLAVLVISAGSFCAALAGPCGYSITIDMGGRHVAPVFSLMNTAGHRARRRFRSSCRGSFDERVAGMPPVPLRRVVPGDRGLLADA